VIATAGPDLSVFERFAFERPPVGLKFSRVPLEGIPPLGRRIALCEALAEAHKGEAFLYSAEDELCAGSLPLGNAPIEPPFAAGEVGPILGVFKEARANRRVYEGLPRLDPGTARYLAFAPLGRITFDPDVLTVTASVSQAEVILRASTYTVGGVYESRTTPVLGCAWVFVYPFVSGRLNYVPTGLVWGSKSLRALPEGMLLVSIPFDLLPMLVANLTEMPWSPAAFDDGRAAYLQRFRDAAARVTGP
jgi:uncharacterized protein (DUF169 family)